MSDISNPTAVEPRYLSAGIAQEHWGVALNDELSAFVSAKNIVDQQDETQLAVRRKGRLRLIVCRADVL